MADELLEPVEMTVEELTELLSSGNPVEVILGEHLSARITIEAVDLFYRFSAEGRALAALTEGLRHEALHLAIPPLSRVLGESALIEPAEMYLFQRALEARASLVGPPV